jgi:hypothetical protein
MKSDLDNIHEETNQKVRQAYLALHTEPYSKDSIQKLEEKLSNDIYDAESHIQKTRGRIPELTEEYYRRRTILKRIADGLAWIILDFNSSQIRACSIGHPPGFMAGKQGYTAERDLVRACAKYPKIRWAIQCDITNVLRLGDVITVNNDGETQPFEVKGSKSGQATRQRQRAKKVVEFINTGIFNDYIKGLGPLHTYKVPITYKYYWKELETLSRKAIEDGIAWKIFDDSLAICVSEKSHSNQEIIDQATQNITANWRKHNLTFRGLGRHMNRDSEILPITRLPLTLFPIDTSLGIRFVLRELDAIIMLNIDITLQKMKEAGLSISKDANGLDVINLPSGVNFSIVDGWEKILLELITVPSFVEYILLSTQKVNNEIPNL